LHEEDRNEEKTKKEKKKKSGGLPFKATIRESARFKGQREVAAKQTRHTKGY